MFLTKKVFVRLGAPGFGEKCKMFTTPIQKKKKSETVKRKLFERSSQPFFFFVILDVLITTGSPIVYPSTLQSS